MLHDLALEDPHLDADDPVGGLGLDMGIIDVGAQRVQRHPALAIPLGAGDLGPAEPSADVDPDALRAHAHGVLDRTLHGAAKRHTALELLGDVLGHQLGVELGAADLDDVEMQLRIGQRRHFLAQLLDIGALLADDHARTRGVDGHPALLVRALDHHAADAGLGARLLDVGADLQILVQQIAVFLGIGVPAAVPGPVDADAQADRIDFMSH